MDIHYKYLKYLTGVLETLKDSDPLTRANSVRQIGELKDKIPIDIRRGVIAKVLKLSKEKDTGTLKYDFYISSDETECEMREEYESSEAVLEHMANLGEHQQEVFSDFPLDHVNVYGNPSPELLEAAKGFDVRVYSFSQGLEEVIVV